MQAVTSGDSLIAVKSFRLYCRPKPRMPDRFVSDYSTEERDRFQIEFRPLGERYRRHQSGAMLFAIAFVVGWALCILFGKTHSAPWLLSGIAFLALMGCLGLAPVLDCPACGNALDEAFGGYCPECGSKSLLPQSASRIPVCSACGRELRRRRRGGRCYAVRACTHCGMPLDSRGL